ncbi:DUF998 domain-containing protein [Streptomyces sp. NBC_01506]|uniref:DUF998 domain-containing protein n=1 Tax=Streptomyces sp. NBC_01506 TaxID=2903887 RepID=UPI00386C6217
MTHTTSVTSTDRHAPINSATSIRPSTRTLLGAGIVAGPLFLGAGVIQGFTRDGFDFTRNAISQLSLGSAGWIQVVSFLLAAVLLVSGAIGLHRAMRDTPGGVWVPRLIGVLGVSFLVSGVFSADPGKGFPAGTPEDSAGSISPHGAVHLVAGMVGYLALCAAFFIVARHFAAEGRRGWAIACRIVPVLVFAGFAGSSSAVLSFTVGAGLGLLALSAVSARLLITRSPARG